ncbi:MAG TPA: 50S ribosomal protein L11 methyltransferase [Dehalococcoidia bacterium]|nr:50S ribosomal protein L11 methyltransferase [Dehalococcoidia bacterium]
MDWLEITVVAAAADEEAVSDVLRAYAGGVAIEGGEGAPGGRGGRLLSLKAYLPRDARLPSRRRALRRALSRIEMSQPLAIAPSRTVREEDWANAWKKHFRVERVGRLVIRPRWRRYAAKDGESVITLDPGMAFGTGQHPTTRMCLLALQERLPAKVRILDLGAGSGILAIAAVLLGAAEVIALDTDPLAVDIAKENVAANGVEAKVNVGEGSLGAAWPFDGAWQRRFDCVVANISSATIIELSGDLVGALRSGGLGIAGGISEERVDDCWRALEEVGARVIDVMAEGEWRTLLFEVT